MYGELIKWDQLQILIEYRDGLYGTDCKEGSFIYVNLRRRRTGYFIDELF